MIIKEITFIVLDVEYHIFEYHDGGIYMRHRECGSEDGLQGMWEGHSLIGCKPYGDTLENTKSLIEKGLGDYRFKTRWAEHHLHIGYSGKIVDEHKGHELGSIWSDYETVGYQDFGDTFENIAESILKVEGVYEE